MILCLPQPRECIDAKPDPCWQHVEEESVSNTRSIPRKYILIVIQLEHFALFASSSLSLCPSPSLSLLSPCFSPCLSLFLSG